MRSAALSVDHLLIVILGMLPHDGLEMNQKTCREKRQNVTSSNLVFNSALLFFPQGLQQTTGNDFEVLRSL